MLNCLFIDIEINQRSQTLKKRNCLFCDNQRCQNSRVSLCVNFCSFHWRCLLSRGQNWKMAFKYVLVEQKGKNVLFETEKLEPFYANSGSETSKSVTFSLMFAVILCWSIFHILLYVFKFGISMFSDSLTFFTWFR